VLYTVIMQEQAACSKMYLKQHSNIFFFHTDTRMCRRNVINKLYCLSLQIITPRAVNVHFTISLLFSYPKKIHIHPVTIGYLFSFNTGLIKYLGYYNMTKYSLMDIRVNHAFSWSQKATRSKEESLQCSISSGLQIRLSNTVHSFLDS